MCAKLVLHFGGGGMPQLSHFLPRILESMMHSGIVSICYANIE